MFKSRLRRLGWALAASCVAVFFASLAPGNASAGVCGSINTNFELGTSNSCNLPTELLGSGFFPLTVSTTAPSTTAFRGYEAAATGSGIGVEGRTDSSDPESFGVFGLLFSQSGSVGSDSAGVFGSSGSTNANGPGVWGLHGPTSGSAPGVLGETYSTSTGSAGVVGNARASTGGGRGVEGFAASSGSGVYGVAGFLTAASPGSPSAAVSGQSSSTSGNGYGVWGVHGQTTGSAPGVEGDSYSTAANATGVTGTLQSTAPGAGSTAVSGINNGTNGNGYGVWGSHAGSGTGVLGQSASGFGVLGVSSLVGVLGYAPAGGFAGYFVGDAVVSGTLYKGAGAFRIDHPLDPAHKYLEHSFVESPDMMDVYNGNVTTNGKGFATVKLPAYFQALNRSFRYQLTSLSGLQEVAVAKEIARNRFTIQSQKPHSRVSWQVTGVRHDAYANAHRIPVVLEKSAKEQGKYLHPELYGKPRSLSLLGVAAKLARLTKGG